jgi:hypothetical protein
MFMNPPSMRWGARIALLLAALSTVGRPVAADGIIRNGVVGRDTNGNEIWCNGGHIIRESDTFYWVGYETAPGRVWNIKLYSSRNLADWRFENDIIQLRPGFALRTQFFH